MPVIGAPILWLRHTSFIWILSVAGCSLVATRPVQEMSDTLAAIRAAKEVQADSLAPELFRLAKEWHLKAQREFRLKDFDTAKNSADRARFYAEQAEFESLKNGGTRADRAAAPSSAEKSEPQSEPMPTPEGTPAEAALSAPARQNPGSPEESKEAAVSAEPNPAPNNDQAPPPPGAPGL